MTEKAHAQPDPSQHTPDPAQPLRVGLWGNFGTGNFGNECTLHAALLSALRHAPQASLLCICSEPADAGPRHGIPAVSISARRTGGGNADGRPRSWLGRKARRLALEAGDWLSACRTVRELDMLLVAGTGVLADGGEGALGLPYELFKWSIVTKLFRRKLCYLSVGVESIDAPLARVFVKGALRLADYRCYRDQQSRERLQKLGFPASADALYPDLAFSLPESLTGGLKLRADERPMVAVGLYAYRNRGEDGGAAARAYQNYLDRLSGFVTWLLDHDYGVRVIIGDWTYDEAVRRDFRARLEAQGTIPRGDRFHDEPAKSFEQVMEQLASVDFVVASRFHNLVLALMLGKPALSVSYDRKNDALLAEMGLGKYAMSLDSFDTASLIDSFSDLERNAPRLRPGILQKVTQYRDQLEEQYERVFVNGVDAVGAAREH